MTGFFAVGVYIYVHHGNPIRSLDLVSLYLMAVPVFILLVHHRPKAEWMWAGVIVGCLSAAGVTIWQTVVLNLPRATGRSEEHTSELQSLMRISYAVFCLKNKNKQINTHLKSV